MTRRKLLLGATAFAAACGRSLSPADEALRKGAAFLWDQQEKDGGWRSKTYGLLRSGQSLTPFVLDALVGTPAEPDRTRVTRAVEFIRAHIREGALGVADDSPDYPNYATALAVQSLCRPDTSRYRDVIPPLITYLRAQQFTEANGWDEKKAPYGGWGMGGGLRVPPHPGHVDISMTRYVLQALRMSGAAKDDSLFNRAAVFVERCQNFDPRKPEDLDGGFFFSTVVLDANKAGHDGKRYRSYGTTTADGILALLAMGYALDHPRVRAARRWLHRNHIPSGAPGFVGEPYQRWKAGLLYYYASASSEAFRELNDGVPAMDALIKLQRADGSWANPENLVKEDDPLIATTFAVKALTNGRGRWSPSSS